MGQVFQCQSIKPMPTKVFSIPSHQFAVFRAGAGAITWSGTYRGMKVAAASPIDAARCLILLDRMASKQEVFENLLCVEPSGNVVWKGELPEQPDSFVEFEIPANGLRAWTWTPRRLDPATGKTLERQFVK